MKHKKGYRVEVFINEIAKTQKDNLDLHQVLTKISNDYRSYDSNLIRKVSLHYFNDLHKAAEFSEVCKTKGKLPLETILIQANGSQLNIQDNDKLSSLKFYEHCQKRDGITEY